jgi:uncharacterized Zn finger protein
MNKLIRFFRQLVCNHCYPDITLEKELIREYTIRCFKCGAPTKFTAIYKGQK